MIKYEKLKNNKDGSLNVVSQLRLWILPSSVCLGFSLVAFSLRPFSRPFDLFSSLFYLSMMFPLNDLECCPEVPIYRILEWTSNGFMRFGIFGFLRFSNSRFVKDSLLAKPNSPPFLAMK